MTPLNDFAFQTSQMKHWIFNLPSGTQWKVAGSDSGSPAGEICSLCSAPACAAAMLIVARPRTSGELMTENRPFDLVITKLMGVLLQENFREQGRMTPDCSWFKEKINCEEIEILRKTWVWIKGTERVRVVAEWDAGSQGASVSLFL